MSRNRKPQLDWRTLKGEEVRNRRMTMRYPRDLAKKDNNNSIRKKLFIYNEYLRIRSSMKEAFPELADYLPKRYYYKILADRLLLSMSYICSIVSYINRMGLEKEAKRFSQNIINDINYDR